MTRPPLVALALAAAAFLLASGGLHAQQPPAPPSPPPAAAPAALLGDDALDDLVAPIALYPDALLAQVLVAATYPLDVVKAQRWVAANTRLSPDARADAAAAQGWDPSVAVLAAGFPTLIGRMADDLDGTEALGEAVIAQTDDVMDAIQRQRGRAAAVGNLESNAAQTVTEEAGAIAIAPANPEVVYVPAYDPATVYTQPASGAPVVVSDPADTGYSTGSLVATGVIAFGAGLLVNELFDDDDDWNGYWGGPPRFDWDDGDFYPRPGRPGINAGGDVNIDIDRDRNIDRDRPVRGPAFSDLRNRPAGERSEAVRDRIGGDGDGLAAARAKIEARSDGAPRPGAAQRDRPAPGGGAAGTRDRPVGVPAGARREAAGAVHGDGPAAALHRAPARHDGAHAAERSRPHVSHGGSRGAALSGGDGGRRAKAAEARGSRSVGGGGGGGRPGRRG
jgi:hypothetical protein